MSRRTCGSDFFSMHLPTSPCTAELVMNLALQRMRLTWVQQSYSSSSSSSNRGHDYGYSWSSNKPSNVSHSPYGYSSPQGRCYICDNYKQYYHNRNSSAGSLNSSNSSSSYSAGSLSMPPYYDYYNSIVSNPVPQMQMYYY